MPETPIIPHTDDPYSKRELDHYFGDMRDSIKEILFDIKEVKIQTIKTNGSVKEHKLYFRTIWIGLGVICSTIVILLPTIIGFIRQVQRLDKTVTELTHKVR